MPLGKLSKKQIESAYKVLNELNQVKFLATALQKQVNSYRDMYRVSFDFLQHITHIFCKFYNVCYFAVD